MPLDQDGMRAFAMTLAHRAVRDIRADGFRQLRSYIDMGALLSKGPGQKFFFTRAQSLLTKTDSLYYPLVQRFLTDFADDQFCTLGVNLAVNSLSCGVVTLRAAVAAQDRDLPWLVRGSAESADERAAFGAAMTEGEKQGAFLYVAECACAEAADEAVRQLAGTHPQSILFVLCPPACVGEALVASLCKADNVVPVLRLSGPDALGGASAAAAALLAARRLYGMYMPVTPAQSEMACGPSFRAQLAQYAPFCVYQNSAPADRKAARALQKAVYAARKAVSTPVILMDWDSDCKSISKYISPRAFVKTLAPQPAGQH